MAGWTPPALPAQWTWTADLPPLVGRRRELEELELWWAAVQHGARQLVLVAGEPGAGKSRLAMEACTALHRRGIPVLLGQCTSDLGLPFDPLVAPVRGLLRAFQNGELEPVNDDLPAAEVSRLLSVLTSGATPDVAQTSLAVVVLGAVVAALAGACATGPVVMVLEDLHWAGESGLRGLRHIVERTADLPLLILATYRDTPPDVSDPLSTMTSELIGRPGVHRLALQGLATPDVSDYLTALQAGDAEAVARAAGILRERTDGNPFLLGEVCREVRDHGGLERLASGQLAVPGSLQAMVRGRLGRLSSPEQGMVGRGAVVGEVFDVDLVHAAGDPQLESLKDVYGGLAAAASMGLIKPLPDRLGTYHFPHALARQAVLAELDAYTVAVTHAAVGRALESAGLRDPSRLLQVAHHYAAATGLGLEGSAAHYLEESAEIATARLAYSDAAALFERAAGLATGARERNRLLLRAAASYVRAARLDRGRAISDAVATSGDPDQRLEAALVYEGTSWRIGVGSARAMELLEQALADAHLDEDDAQRLVATACHGRELIMTGRLAEGVQELERVVSVVRGIGDDRLLLAVLTKSLSPSANVGVSRDVAWLRRQRELAVEATALAAAAGERDALGSAAEVRLFAAYVLGDPEGFTLALSDLRRVALATHDPFWLWRVDLMEGSAHLLNCDFVATAESLAATRHLGASFGYRWEEMDGPWSLQSYVLRRETGGLEFARAALEAGRTPSNAWAPGVVAIHCELGMVDQARATLHLAIEQGLPALRDSVTWPGSLALLAEGAVWLSDRAAAEVLLAEVEPFSGLNLMGAEFLAPFGSADRLLAALLGVLGGVGVEDHFAAALELDTRMGATLHVATTQAEWAAWLRRSHARDDRVEEHAAPARRLADRFGLVRVRRILGTDAASGPRSGSAGLTAREIEVLRLVGRGRSNREIAAALFISEHTAANHVRSILMKTQAANRTAAAHYARQHGLIGDDDSGDRHP